MKIIRQKTSGSRHDVHGQIKRWGAMMMRVSILITVVTMMGCLNNSNGQPVRNRCGDAPPPFDNTKINPGMYVVQGAGGDTSALSLTVEIYHSNGILYTRTRIYPDSVTIAPGNSATESWDRYLDSSNQIMGIGLGGTRGISPGGIWSQNWAIHGGLNPFFKANVTANSFQTMRKYTITDNEGNKVDCRWDATTYLRIGSDQSSWPTLVNWLEVWPDSVKRN